MNPKRKIVITSSGNPVSIKLPKNIKYITNLTKKEYYSLLAEAKYYLSTAYQETFGYTLQEAIHFGCQILVPDRLCYPEMVPKENLYSNFTEAIEKIENNDLSVSHSFTELWDNNFEKLILPNLL